ncbi:UNVERIFIED_ORG: hypothetical protein E4P37_16165 [Bacillus sp. AZ43]
MSDGTATVDGRNRSAVRPQRVTPGVLAAVVLFAVLGALGALSAPLFASADESAHAAYGLTLSQDGRLPTLFETVEPILPGQEPKPQHVANHPPLFYVLTGPLLHAGVASGHLVGGYLLARGLSVLFSAVTVLLVAAFAHEIFRGRRPAVTVGAAALTAVHGLFVAVSGVLHNDALGVMFSAAVLWLVVRVLRRGPTPGLVAALALTGLGGTAVRANNASLVLIASLAVLLAAVAHRPAGSSLRHGLVRGLGAGLVVGGTSLVGIGWFFLRNLELYGNALGYGVLEGAFGRAPREETFWLLRHPSLVLRQLGLPGPDTVLSVGGLLTLLPFLLAVTGLGWPLLPPAWAAIRRRARPSWTGLTTRNALIGLLVLHTLITVVMVLRHTDAGGGIHVRYLFPLLPLVATTAAAGLLWVPGGRRGVWLGVALVAGLLTTLEALGRSGWRWDADAATGAPLAGIVLGFSGIGIPAPAAVVTVALVMAVAALATVVVRVWRLTGPGGSAGPRTTEPQPVADPLPDQPRSALA